MLKKLRIKFVVINMLLVSLVLLVVIGAQAVSNYRQVQGTCDVTLQVALQPAGKEPVRWEMERKEPMDRQPGQMPGRSDGQTAIIPTVCVELDETGVITAIRQDNVDVSEEVLQTAVTAVLETGGDSGVLSDPDLRYLVRRNETGVVERVAFADRTWEKGFLSSQMLTSALTFLVAFAGFLVISMFLSGWALKPVKKTWAQQKQFMADASHELKTPLTVMLADVRILLAHQSETVGAMQKWVYYIEDEAKRMRQLVEDMLFLAHNDATDDHERVREKVVLSDVVWSCLLPFEAVAFERGVTLEGDVPAGLTMRGDEEQLRRLIVILLDNACKYAGEGGTVKLRLARKLEGLMLAVHNTGDPIPPEVQKHLFERFYRAEDSRDREKGGYGLGLAIADSIVQGHRGRIGVTSDALQGTVFAVYLPEW